MISNQLFNLKPNTALKIFELIFIFFENIGILGKTIDIAFLFLCQNSNGNQHFNNFESNVNKTKNINFIILNFCVT
ncbi:hypothetical protein D9V84_02650 [Bacteroidetes/Chlorobi group bacterium Naka2016]|nr:MAG: hypothetical protein D9V84_02650 [Bacteroidetes/Chlorobi group bacterium Naka2016]